MSDNTFLQDVLDGLNSNPKTLPAKYFYDDKGDQLFQQIMKLKSYYLSRAESEILKKFSINIAANMKGDEWEIIELGAGDGSKTQTLLKALIDQQTDVIYRPVDISSAILDQLKSLLTEQLPALKCNPIASDYFSLKLEESAGKRRLFLFLGGNLGNYTSKGIILFFRLLNSLMKKGDQIILGLDLIKDPKRILAAYNDPEGVTANFNFNLLHRINTELNANLDIHLFQHWATYDPILQEARSYLISKEEKNYSVMDGQHSVHFEEWEAIQVETSKKYSSKQLAALAQENGFQQIRKYQDENKDFVDVLWIKL